jgi:hypothetical protein
LDPIVFKGLDREIAFRKRIRWIVTERHFDFFDNSLWDQPRRARAALI